MIIATYKNSYGITYLTDTIIPDHNKGLLCQK